MKTCEDCGSRVYNLGCTWCNEVAYIAEQDRLTDLQCEPVRTSFDRVFPGMPPAVKLSA